MCGRYNLEIRDDFYSRFRIENKIQTLRSHYNMAPSQKLPVIVRNSPNKVILMKWGITPPWEKESKRGIINARRESVSEKPTFKRLLSHNRCLVPATGYYEWKPTTEGKRPYHFHFKKLQYFGFAGLYTEHKTEEGIECMYTIITTAATNTLAHIHNRMPLIVDTDKEDVWMDGKTSVEEINEILNHPHNESLITDPISTAINTLAVDSERLLTPVEI